MNNTPISQFDEKIMKELEEISKETLWEPTNEELEEMKQNFKTMI